MRVASFDTFFMREETANKILESVRTAYDTIADEFAASRDALWWPELDEFGRCVKNGDRVLDIGCGSGRMHKLFAGTAVEYEGLDVSEGIIERARRRRPDLLAGFRVGSALALPYEDGSFDAALMVAVLHHVPSERYRLQALREASRVLKPGGRLLMTNWNLWRAARRKWIFRSWLLKLIGRSDLDWNDAWFDWKKNGQPAARRYYHAFALGELGRLCRAAGLKVEKNVRVDNPRHGRDANILTICRKPANE